ncbi:phage portal protein [Larkinella humicola]|uniref:Phage portal protein n=1 Tax=Larkinella humicola TaxID=2607654 RepID=A0A5N1JRH5_9BACT|nr:phage portal protein [Larkinella humicola]KAA9357229.1 phage portal protein [Larkinella humicola]
MTSWDDLHLSGGGKPNALAGVNVTSDTALKVSAVYRAVNLIANTVAMLPKAVYKETKNGRDIDRTDLLQQLFFRSPDEFMTWYEFMFALVASCLLNGNGYAQIIRGPYMEPLGLRFLTKGECTPLYQNTGRNRYLYYFVFGELVEKRDIIHIKCLGSDGVIGKSPIALFRESIGLAKAAEEYGARFFGQGGNMSGALETDQVLKDQKVVDRLRTQFAERYGGLANSHKPLLLEAGMKYNRISIPPDDAQFIETRSFQVEDIARIYGTPQHKLGKLDKATNNNIEHQSKEFVTDTILPWTERIRQEFEMKLIAEDEKEIKEIVFDFDFLLRGDSAARATLYQARFASGSLTPNEIKRKENENPSTNPGMDDYYIQLGFSKVTGDSHRNAPKSDTSTPKPPTE